MNNIKDLTDLLYEMSLPSQGRMPGLAPLIAMERAFGMAVAHYLCYSSDSLADLMMGTDDNSAAMRIGRGFVASVVVNTGNKYGVIGLMVCLRSFDGEEVSPAVGELLEMLEAHLKAAGGTISLQEEGPSSP
jgi:hypothetical protein